MVRFLVRLFFAWSAEALIIRPPDPNGPLLTNIRNARSRATPCGVEMEFDADVNPAAHRKLVRAVRQLVKEE